MFSLTLRSGFCPALFGRCGAILCFTALMALGAHPLDQWTLRNPLVTSEDLYSVTFGNGVFVAVGGAGAVCVSADGASWNSRKLGAHLNLFGVTWGNGQFIAVGGETHHDPVIGASYTGVVYASRDGVTWARQPTAIPQPLYRVAWSGDRFVALGSRGWNPGTETYAWSDDGSNWTSFSPGDSFGYGNDVTFDGTRFVSASSGAIRTSLDGVNWTAVTNLGNAIGIASGAGRLVTVGGWGLIAMSSDGGTTWTQAPSGTTDFLYDVSFCNNRFLAVGIAGRLLSSPDGSTWTHHVSGTESLLEDVTWGNGAFVAVGRDGAALLSRDGQTWTNISNATLSLTDIASGNNTFVAVGPRATYSSANGIEWRSRPSVWLESVCFGQGKFVAAGVRLLTSVDGVTWTDAGVSLNNPLAAVRFGNGLFVAVGGSDALGGGETLIYTSSNGISWTRTARPGARLDFLVFDDGKFWTAPRNGGSIGTSTDGVNWTWTLGTFGAQPAGLAAGNGLTVLADATGTVHTFRDGQRIASTSVAGHLAALSFAGGHFIAMGGGWDGATTRPATISTSTDGVSWTTRPYVSLQPLRAAVYGAHRLLLVGDSGTILASGPMPSGCGLVIRPRGSQLSVEWTTSLGVRCKLQRSFDAVTWNDVGEPIMGDGLVARYSVAPEGRAFFRVAVWE